MSRPSRRGEHIRDSAATWLGLTPPKPCPFPRRLKRPRFFQDAIRVSCERIVPKAHSLYPEGLAGHGQGIQLASSAGRPDLPRNAPLLAEGDTSFDSAAR
jgi:hypothetical protein